MATEKNLFKHIDDSPTKFQIYGWGDVLTLLASCSLSSADDLCKQFGPTLGGTLDPNSLTLMV